MNIAASVVDNLLFDNSTTANFRRSQTLQMLEFIMTKIRIVNIMATMNVYIKLQGSATLVEIFQSGKSTDAYMTKNVTILFYQSPHLFSFYFKLFEEVLHSLN